MGSKRDDGNRSSGSEHTKAGDGRRFRGNARDTDSTAGKHVGDRSKPPQTGNTPDYEPRHSTGD